MDQLRDVVTTRPISLMMVIDYKQAESIPTNHSLDLFIPLNELNKVVEIGQQTELKQY